ncbi:MAG: aminopeptidase P family protein [Lentisphaerales bacterium]|nr:aminopeptidase P family protein [Lentisphaerales bacterium]
MNITAAEYAERRRKVLEILGDHVLILFSNFEHQKNSDVNFKFRQDSSFYYLTGFNEPDSILVLDPQGDDKFLMFVPPKDSHMEMWEGFRYGPKGVVETFGADKAWDNSELGKALMNRLKYRSVQVIEKSHHPLQEELQEIIFKSGAQREKQYAYREIHRMRKVKSAAEIELIRKACRISSAAHNLLIENVKDFTNEADLENEFVYFCAKQGSQDQAYYPIMASGENATCLHYQVNNQAIDKQGNILVDAGCSVDYYASDITRTFPASGSFTEEQRLIYKAVLKTQKLCLEAVRPGISFLEIDQIARKSITEGLINIGLIIVPLEEAMRKELCKEFYPHNIGHHLGLDVHDCDGLDYEEQRGRNVKYKLEEGMVITIEPGIYIQNDNLTVHAKWRGIGVRIEDDILITEDGHENLTFAAYKELDDIER